MIPIHASFGLTTFILAAVACLTGLTEKVIWTLEGAYSQFQDEGIVVNALGMTLIALIVTMTYAVRSPSLQAVCSSERL